MPAKTQKRAPPPRKRRSERRIGCGAAYILITGLAIVAGLVYVSGQFFRVASVEVVGAQRLNAAQIVQTADIHVGENLLFLRKTAVSQRLFGSFAYLEELRITRGLTGRIVLTVTERQPVVCIQQEGWFWIADGSGRLLEQTSLPSQTEGIARVDGIVLLEPMIGQSRVFPADQRDKFPVLLQLTDAFREWGLLGSVARVDLTRAYDVSFQYGHDGQFHVILGLPANLEAKLSMFVHVRDNELGPYDRGTIDLTAERVARFEANPA